MRPWSVSLSYKYSSILYHNNDKSKHPWGLSWGNANTCHNTCRRERERERDRPEGRASARPGVPRAAARWTTCTSQVWPSTGKSTTQLRRSCSLREAATESRSCSRVMAACSSDVTSTLTSAWFFFCLFFFLDLSLLSFYCFTQFHATRFYRDKSLTWTINHGSYCD